LIAKRESKVKTVNYYKLTLKD